jgi:tetratricopeptide (TPR) repeat protein
MFFPRLRKRAKWVFLFLALAFAFGFVGFGVGAGGSGIGDYFAELFNRTPGTGVPSIDSAQERVDKNPADADAQLDLANAYQLDQQTDKAIAALTAFLVIEPENTDALLQLTSLYLEQQNKAQIAAQNAQASAGASAFEGLLFDPSGTVGPSLGGKITGVQRTESQGAYTDALIRNQEAAKNEADTWEKLVALEPDDTSFLLSLANAATQANDPNRAVEAYEAYLKASPDDANKAQIEDIIKQLKEAPNFTPPDDQE